MVAAVETMAYAGDVPWHGLGTPVREDMTPDEILVEAGLDWSVSKRKMYLDSGVEVPRAFALVRDSDDSVLSVVGPTYKPVQNRDALSFFDKFVKLGKMRMETAGSLWDGRHVWGLARMEKSFVLPGDDEVKNFLMIHQPHLRDRSLVIQYTSVRVVCWNTLSMALNRASESVFRMVHSRVFDEATMHEAERVLGLANDTASDFQQAAEFLASKSVTDQKLEEYFCQVLQFDPTKAKRKKDGEIRWPRLMPKFKEAFEVAPGHETKSAVGTWWGALNAVTFAIDHAPINDNERRLRSAWFGPGDERKRRALHLAVEYAKAA